MVLQQGVFLCLGDPGRDVLANLDAEVEDEDPLRIVKIEFRRSDRGQALGVLRRLNISRESLFPGLDGLAQSLAHQFVPRDFNREALVNLLGQPRGWPGLPPGSAEGPTQS
jgi:hypothetical protein